MPLLLHADRLRRIEYVRLFLKLESLDDFVLSWEVFCRLRRRFSDSLEGTDGVDPELRALLLPPAFSDPQLRMRHRHPASGVVLRPRPSLFKGYGRGEPLALECLFLGRAISGIPGFLRLIARIGTEGLLSTGGRFRLVGVTALDAAGGEVPVSSMTEPQFPVNDAAWYLLSGPPGCTSLRLSFQTPARLLRCNRPLFRPRSSELLPYVLRRITSMVQTWCDIDLVPNPAEALHLSRRVEGRCDLEWTDWRSASFNNRQQELGGLLGEAVLSGPSVPDLAPLIRLCSLFNLGKGASFGAGTFTVEDNASPSGV